MTDWGASGCRGTQLLPSRVRVLSEVEKAYVGAMIDAEGSIYPYNNNGCTHLRVCVSNTDVELISAMLRATGTGYVALQSKPGGRKRCWQWYVCRQLEIKDLLEQIVTYSIKAQKALAPDYYVRNLIERCGVAY